MFLFKRLFLLHSHRSTRILNGDYNRIIQDSDEPASPHSEDRLSLNLPSKAFLAEYADQTHRYTFDSSIGSGKWPLAITLLLFLISLTLNIVVRTKIDAACLHFMEPWSPLTKHVKYEWQQFDSESCPHEYCGAPSKEREDAWKQLWDLGWMGFPRQSLSTLNKSPTDSWLHPVHPVNENALVAMPEVIHQMHCVSLIREAIYRNKFDFTGYINTSRIEFDLHVNHCLLALKLIIECKADSGPVILEEIEESETSGKNHQISAWKLRDPPKQCRRFEPLRSWYGSHTICSSFCGAPEIYNGKLGKHGD